MISCHPAGCASECGVQVSVVCDKVAQYNCIHPVIIASSVLVSI